MVKRCAHLQQIAHGLDMAIANRIIKMFHVWQCLGDHWRQAIHSACTRSKSLSGFDNRSTFLVRLRTAGALDWTSSVMIHIFITNPNQ